MMFIDEKFGEKIQEVSGAIGGIIRAQKAIRRMREIEIDNYYKYPELDGLHPREIERRKALGMSPFDREHIIDVSRSIHDNPLGNPGLKSIFKEIPRNAFTTNRDYFILKINPVQERVLLCEMPPERTSFAMKRGKKIQGIMMYGRFLEIQVDENWTRDGGREHRENLQAMSSDMASWSMTQKK